MSIVNMKRIANRRIRQVVHVLYVDNEMNNCSPNNILLNKLELSIRNISLFITRRWIVVPSVVIGEAVENRMKRIGAWKSIFLFMTTIYCTAISVRGLAVQDLTFIWIVMFIINHTSAHTAPTHSTNTARENNTKKCFMNELLTDTNVIFVHSRHIPRSFWLYIRKANVRNENRYDQY